MWNLIIIPQIFPILYLRLLLLFRVKNNHIKNTFTILLYNQIIPAIISEILQAAKAYT